MNNKKAKKEQLVIEIYKSEPVRPSELPMKRIRYDLLTELEAEGRILIKKYGNWLTLLAKPNHEELCGQRERKESKRNLKNDIAEQGDIKIRKEIIDQVVSPLIYQMSGFIIEDDRIMIPHGSLRILRSYHLTKLDAEKNPLYSEFTKTCKEIDPNPHDEYEKFQKKSKEFLDSHKSISNEIQVIVSREFAPEIHHKNERDSMKLMHSFSNWIEKETRRLYKRSEKEQKSAREVVNARFNYIYNNFVSKIEEKGNSYTYFFFFRARLRHPPVKYLCWKANKNNYRKSEFQKQTDQRIRNILLNIASSDKIMDSFDNIIALKKELNEIKNNIVVGLEKYKASYSPDLIQK